MKCPNCGEEVDPKSKLCANCGGALYPRELPLQSGDKMRRLAFGRPFSKRVALALAIVGGLAGGAIGTCGLIFALQAGDVTQGFGVFFAILGLVLLLYVYWEWRRANRN